jgi:hypothetical protein
MKAADDQDLRAGLFRVTFKKQILRRIERRSATGQTGMTCTCVARSLLLRSALKQLVADSRYKALRPLPGLVVVAAELEVFPKHDALGFLRGGSMVALAVREATVTNSEVSNEPPDKPVSDRNLKNRLRARLQFIGGALASIAAVGAVVGGLVGCSYLCGSTRRVSRSAGMQSDRTLPSSGFSKSATHVRAIHSFVVSTTTSSKDLEKLASASNEAHRDPRCSLTSRVSSGHKLKSA